MNEEAAARLASMLERMHARKTTDEPSPAAEDVYPTAIRHFSRQEELLRGQASVTRELLAKMKGEVGLATQRVLRLHAQAGGVAGGRFWLVNDSGAELRFRFEPRFSLPARFSPDAPSIQAGERVAVDVRLDLAGAPFSAGETPGLLVDVTAGGQVRVKLWIDLSLDAP